MAIKGIIFDMDGTLSDTLDDLTAALNFTLRWAGCPERTRAEVRTFVGDGVNALVYRGLPESSRERHAECCNVFRGYYVAHLTDHTKPYEGINDLLKELKAKGYLLAIVSNKPQEPLNGLVKSFWGDMIDCAVGMRPNVAAKPAPDMVYLALEFLALTPEEVIYVGDSPVDIQTAVNAGLRGASCTWGFCDAPQLREYGAQALIDEPKELLELLSE